MSFMKISKVVFVFMQFIDNTREIKIDPEDDNFLNTFEEDLKLFLRKRHINFDKFVYKFFLALKQDFFEVDQDAETLAEAFSVSKHFADYVLEQEKGFTKFLYGLIGSCITVVGGLIGALIAALL